MTLKEFIAYNKGANEDTVVEYGDKIGVLYWGETGEICWHCDFEESTHWYRFEEEQEFLASKCFWGKCLEEIVKDLMVDGSRDYRKRPWEK